MPIICLHPHVDSHVYMESRGSIIRIPINQSTQFLDHAKISVREASVILIKKHMKKKTTPKPKHKFTNICNNYTEITVQKP